MDDKSKAMLDEILAKEPAALTDGDKEFLKARRSYLTADQKVVYAEVLGEEPQGESFEPEPENQEPPVAQGAPAVSSRGKVKAK